MQSKLYAKLKNIRGFTLIELLIVIAIIGILTVAFLPTLRGGQSGARNAARKAALGDVSVAIERIISGDIPTGVVLTTAKAGSIPVSGANGVCLDFAAVGGLGSDLALVMAKNPVLQPTNANNLCSGGSFYFRSYPAGNNPNPTNYILAVQVEPPVSNGNLNAISTSSAVTIANVNNELPDFPTVLTKTQGTSNSLVWVISK